MTLFKNIASNVVILLLCTQTKLPFLPGSSTRNDPKIQLSGNSTRQSNPLFDSLTNRLKENGIQLEKKAELLMDSQFEMPVILPLNAGSNYYFLFIADSTSRFIETRLYDYDEKLISYQKRQVASEGRFILFQLTARFDELYMFKPLQIGKKKKLNGIIALYKLAE